MTRVAYFDLANGISGDMTIAALAHAGRRLGEPIDDVVSNAVDALGLGCTVSFIDDERGGLACLRAEVKTDATRHPATRLREAIEAADVRPAARRQALAAIDLLIEAEARVHGVDPNDVHLHELGSADTAADLLGAAVALDALGITAVAAAPAPVPSGWITSGHGPLPLPAPVTLELLGGARLRGVEQTEELVTPSGAAVLAAAASTFGPAPEMNLEAVGVGGGSRVTPRPNVCRVLVGVRVEALEGPRVESCVLLETNIDDQTPEGIAHAVEELLAHGAVDAWITPIVMKKSRPAFLLSALVRLDDEGRLTEQIFRSTTTLGVRRREVSRAVLDREELRVIVDGHEVRVKVGRLRGAPVNVAPEFADCVAAAGVTGLATKDIYARAVALAHAALSE
jgi:uncharacterized protein (TIGR00299 family) protein